MSSIFANVNNMLSERYDDFSSKIFLKYNLLAVVYTVFTHKLEQTKFIDNECVIESKFLYEDPKYILEDLENVVDFFKGKNVVLIGFGGVTWNILDILTNSYLIFGNSGPLFNHLVVFEPDNLEWHNIFRLPIRTWHGVNVPKIKYLDYYEPFCERLTAIPEKATIQNLEPYLNDDYIIFGAFDLETRKIFVEEQVPVIYTGLHMNDATDIYISRIDKDSKYEDILRETYGQLHIPAYQFMCFMILKDLIELLQNNHNKILHHIIKQVYYKFIYYLDLYFYPEKYKQLLLPHNLHKLVGPIPIISESIST